MKYVCRVKRQRNTGLFKALGLLFLSALFFALAALDIFFKSLCLLGLITLLFSVYAFCTGVLAEFEYLLYDDVFTVYRVFGKGRKRVFDLDMRLVTGGTVYENKKERRNILQGSRIKYDLSPDCGPKSKIILEYHLGEYRYALCIAPDDTMRALITQYLSSRGVDISRGTDKK